MFFSHFLVRNHLSIISILSDLLAISVGSGELLLLPEVGFALRGSEAGASRGPFPAAPVPAPPPRTQAQRCLGETW